MVGLEIDIRFISMAQAVAIHASLIQDLGGEPGLRDVVALENALHAPMILCDEGGCRVPVGENGAYSIDLQRAVAA